MGWHGKGRESRPGFALRREFGWENPRRPAPGACGERCAPQWPTLSPTTLKLPHLLQEGTEVRLR